MQKQTPQIWAYFAYFVPTLPTMHFTHTRNRLGIRLSFQNVEKVVEKSWRAYKGGSMCHSTASFG